MSNVDHPNQLPTVLSLCTGYGGIERGLSLAGFAHRTVAYVETEAFAIANLVAKMEEGQLVPAPVWSDLKTLPVDCFRERIDVLTGGYPCQPFSAAGLRKGTEDPRHLWPFIRRHIETIRPVRCFFENVEGHISLGLREVIEDLESLGYQTAWGIFSAAGVGAPHQRKRVYILAVANGFRLEKRSLSNREWNGEGEKQGRNNKPAGVDQTSAVAHARCRASSKGEQQAELRPTGSGESSGCTWYDSTTSAYAEGQTWPAGAGPEQYQFEEPRVIWKAQSELGGAADGSAHRVDRLRLLGNGVVPQTAALAWIVLNDQLASE